MHFCAIFNISIYCASEWRELICKSKDAKNTKDASDCEVLLKEEENDQNGRKVPLNTCFDVSFHFVFEKKTGGVVK